MKKPVIIHPFLFALFPILFLFAHNQEELIAFSDTLLPLAAALGFTLVSFLLCWLIIRNAGKAGIIISIFLVLFFSYGHVYDALKSWQISGFTMGKHQYLLFAWGIVFLTGIVLALKTGRDLRNFTGLLNVVAASLVLISLFNIGLYMFETGSVRASTAKSGEERAAIAKDPNEKTTARDIYFIVLDGYANPTTLEEVYGYDNSDFIDYLDRKGFNITPRSRSNYAVTYLSLASSLNMEYLNHLTDKVGAKSKNRKITHQLVRDNKVIKFLKARGYKTIHFSSGWSETLHNEYADINIKCGAGNEFTALLIQTTMLGYFEQDLLGNNARERVLGTFSKLARTPGIKEPKFVFAHILTPHPPYLFDRNGRPVEGTKLKMCGQVWLEKQNYLNQLEFVNQKVKVLIDEILAKSDVPPIIILQSDHRSASLISRNHSRGWESPTKAMLKERMRIFSAYYLPAGGEKLLYESITPGNNFRLIFNYYFQADYQFLDDQSYFSSYNQPFDFTNVTDKVRF